MAEPTEEQVIVDEGGEVETPAEVVEKIAEDASEAELTDEVEGEEEGSEEEEEPEAPISRRKALRIQALLSKLGETEAPAQPRKAQGGLDYKTSLEADEETVKTLEEDRRKYGDQLYREGLEEAKSIQFTTRLEIDAPRVEAKYPVLDKESPKFNPVVANALNQMYLSAVGWNPDTRRVSNANVRYADYIESIMELSDEVASEKVARSTKNIAKQAATTGIRPSGNTSKRLNLNQAPKDMNDDELKAIIAQSL